MRVSVVPEDRCITVDEVQRHVDMPPVDENWRALSYDGSTLRFEVRSGFMDTVSGDSAAQIIAPFVEAWEAAAPPPSTPADQPEGTESV